MCVCVIVKMSFKARDNLLRSLSLKFYRRTEEEEEEEILSLSLSLSLPLRRRRGGGAGGLTTRARVVSIFRALRVKSLSLSFFGGCRGEGEREKKKKENFFFGCSRSKNSLSSSSSSSSNHHRVGYFIGGIFFIELLTTRACVCMYTTAGVALIKRLVPPLFPSLSLVLPRTLALLDLVLVFLLVLVLVLVVVVLVLALVLVLLRLLRRLFESRE